MEGAFKNDLWTMSEDQTLVSLVAQLGKKWTKCSKLLRRSPEACRTRWKLLCSRLQAMRSLAAAVAAAHRAHAPPGSLVDQVDTAAAACAVEPAGEQSIIADAMNSSVAAGAAAPRELEAVGMTPAAPSSADAAASPTSAREPAGEVPIAAERLPRMEEHYQAEVGFQDVGNPPQLHAAGTQTGPSSLLSSATGPSSLLSSALSSNLATVQDPPAVRIDPIVRTRSQRERAADDGLVSGYLQPLQLFLLGEDNGHYRLPGGETLGTLQNGRLKVSGSIISGAGRGLFASATFDEGVLVAVYGGQLVHYAQQRTTGRKQYCLRISSSDWAVDGHLFACCLKASQQDGCHWPGVEAEAARWRQGPACMANNSQVFKNTALKFLPLQYAGSGKEVPMLPRVPALVATKKILDGEEIFFNYGCSPSLLKQPSICVDIGQHGEELCMAMRMLRSSCSKNNSQLAPGREDFYSGLLRGGKLPRSRRGAESLTAWEVCWWHPAYQSFALHPVPLDADLLEAVQQLVPSSSLPTNCQTVEDVVDVISKSSFWDDMVYFTASGLSKKRRFLHTNQSKVPSARVRSYSKVLSTVQVGDHPLLQMYKYTRAYALVSDCFASPLPPCLSSLCKAVSLLLGPLFREHKLNHKEFNHVQVRGSYEAFQPQLGKHSDNGIVDEDGHVGKKGSQVPNSPVVIYMIGSCKMDLEFHPVVDNRPGVCIPFGHDWLFVLMPSDDCRCKHSLRMRSPEHVDVTKYRISFVLRELMDTALFDDRTRKIHLCESQPSSS